MTWKSYAAVSGATVLAGWLASSPPSNTPPPAAAASPRTPRHRDASVNDIQEQATRLQSRLRGPRAYAAPQRNPFRFAERVSTPSSRAEQPLVPETPTEPVDLAPPAPRIVVAGIAEEEVDGRVERTAILSSPMGVLFVHEGDEILNYYRVNRIEAEAVEFLRLTDGAPTRFTFGTPQ